MAKHREDLADDTEVTWLEDDEEFEIADLWITSINGGMSGTVVNYDVVKDRCKSLKMDVFEVYKVCRSMTGEFNKKD